MTSLLKPPTLATGVATSILVMLMLTPMASFAETPSLGITTPIAAANLGSADVLAHTPTQQYRQGDNPAGQRYPFTTINGWHLSHGWFFGKPTNGHSRVGFVWESPEEQSSLSTIHLSTKGLRLVRRF